MRNFVNRHSVLRIHGVYTKRILHVRAKRVNRNAQHLLINSLDEDGNGFSSTCNFIAAREIELNLCYTISSYAVLFHSQCSIIKYSIYPNLHSYGADPYVAKWAIRFQLEMVISMGNFIGALTHSHCNKTPEIGENYKLNYMYYLIRLIAHNRNNNIIRYLHRNYHEQNVCVEME